MKYTSLHRPGWTFSQLNMERLRSAESPLEELRHQLIRLAAHQARIDHLAQRDYLEALWQDVCKAVFYFEEIPYRDLLTRFDTECFDFDGEFVEDATLAVEEALYPHDQRIGTFWDVNASWREYPSTWAEADVVLYPSSIEVKKVHFAVAPLMGQDRASSPLYRFMHMAWHVYYYLTDYAMLDHHLLSIEDVIINTLE